MALPKINPTTTNAWKNLQEHFNQVKDLKMKSLFAEDADRADKMTIKWEDFYVDFSKNISFYNEFYSFFQFCIPSGLNSPNRSLLRA